MRSSNTCTAKPPATNAITFHRIPQQLRGPMGQWIGASSSNAPRPPAALPPDMSSEIDAYFKLRAAEDRKQVCAWLSCAANSRYE